MLNKATKDVTNIRNPVGYVFNRVEPAFRAVPLDTLAQLPPKSEKPHKNTQKRNKETLLRRARSKYFTQQIALPLAELRGDLEKYYRNAYYCNCELHQVGQKITAKYCNTRICNNCNRIRTAKMINGYRSEIEAMQEPQFVTLTIPNVPAQTLTEALDQIRKRFRLITKRFQKAKMKYAGIRKLEITYNPIRNDYHPHLHCIIDGEENARYMQAVWLELWPDALPIAQDIRPVDNSSMNELFKYAAKVVDTKDGERPTVYIHALDVIMRALYRRRIIQPFGSIKKEVSEDVDELQAEEYDGIPYYDMMTWQWQKCDWVNEYGELLTGYTPSEELLKLVVINNSG